METPEGPLKERGTQKRPRDELNSDGGQMSTTDGVQTQLVDPDLAKVPLEELGLQAFSVVSCVESADSLDFNRVTVLRVRLYNATTKSECTRVISLKSFKKINQAKSAWKKFVQKPTTKELKKRKMEHPVTSLPLIVPVASPHEEIAAPHRIKRAEKSKWETHNQFL